MPVTRKDIARELNISDSLVGKVLNGNANVWASAELCERIRQTAHEMGYRPNAAAQALARGRTNLVAVCTIRLDLYARQVTYLQSLAQAEGYEVLVRQVEYAPVEWNWPADGIIAIDAPAWLGAYRKQTRGEAIPIVTLGVEEINGLDQSFIDLVSGTMDALRHFIKKGRRRIAYLMSKHAVGKADDGRWRAYEDAMRSINAPLELIVADDMSPAASYRALLAHTKEYGAPEALLVFASDMVTGAIHALRETGKLIPNDIAVVTIDDTPELAFLEPPISAIEVPIETAAKIAWQLLRRRMNDASAPIQRIVQPTRFVSRTSTENFVSK